MSLYIRKKVKDDTTLHVSQEIYYQNSDEETSKWSLYTLLEKTGGFIAGGLFRSLREIESIMEMERRIDLPSQFTLLRERDFGDPSLHTLIRDVDLYFDDEEKFKKARKTLSDSGFTEIFETENSVGFNAGRSPTIELVRRQFKSMKETLDTFDFTVSKKCIYLDEEGELFTIEHPRHSDNLTKKKLELSSTFDTVGIPPEALFYRVFKYTHLYEYNITDDVLLKFLEAINSKTQSQIPFKNFKNFFSNADKLFYNDFIGVGNEELVGSSYSSKFSKRLLFETLLKMNFEEKKRLEKSNVQRLNTLLSRLDSFKYLSSVSGFVARHNYIVQYQLEELLKSLEPVYEDSTYKDQLDLYSLMRRGLGHLSGFELFYLMKVGVDIFGKKFIKLLSELRSLEVKFTVPTFSDWLYSVEEGLLDLSLPPVLLTSMILGVSEERSEEIDSLVLTLGGSEGREKSVL